MPDFKNVPVPLPLPVPDLYSATKTFFFVLKDKIAGQTFFGTGEGKRGKGFKFGHGQGHGHGHGHVFKWLNYYLPRMGLFWGSFYFHPNGAGEIGLQKSGVLLSYLDRVSLPMEQKRTPHGEKWIKAYF